MAITEVALRRLQQIAINPLSIQIIQITLIHIIWDNFGNSVNIRMLTGSGAFAQFDNVKLV